jgi:hypothetical protein
VKSPSYHWLKQASTFGGEGADERKKKSRPGGVARAETKDIFVLYDSPMSYFREAESGSINTANVD